jgi:hypothetical protein
MQIGLGSSSGLGPIKERRFTIVGGINNTPINNNFLGSHKHSSVEISCQRLPHEGLSSPIVITACTVIVNMVTSLIESTKMDEDEYEVLLVNPQRTFKSPTKTTIESFVDEEYANCPSPPKKQNQGTLES